MLMKTLYILRHAKAAGSFDGFDDIDRPLKPRGLQDAYALGQALAVRGLKVDLTAVSSAARTLQTASVVVRTAGLAFENLRVAPELYLPNDGETLDYVRQLPNEVASAMVVGHNPDLSYLCQELLGDPPDDVLPDLVLGPVVAEQRSLREAHPARDRRRRQLARVLLCGELDDRPDGDGPALVGGEVSGPGGSCFFHKASNQLLA